MTACNFLSISILSSCFTNWKKSFGCHPLSKNINQYPNNRILSYYTPFCFQCHCLGAISVPASIAFLSYQFSNYTIYATIGDCLYLPCIRASSSNNCNTKKKMLLGLLTGILTSGFTAYAISKMNFQLNFMVTLFLLYWLSF